jgi:hypothetical protein
VEGFGLVASAGVVELMKCPAAEEAHTRLAVSHWRRGHEREDGAREPVHRPPVRWHRLEVGEAVADDELGVCRRGEERRDRRRRVLAVGVYDEYGVRGGFSGAELGQPRPDGVALPAVDGEP